MREQAHDAQPRGVRQGPEKRVDPHGPVI
jgi:hypothetical protein